MCDGDAIDNSEPARPYFFRGRNEQMEAPFPRNCQARPTAATVPTNTPGTPHLAVPAVRCSTGELRHAGQYSRVNAHQSAGGCLRTSAMETKWRRRLAEQPPAPPAPAAGKKRRRPFSAATASTRRALHLVAVVLFFATRVTACAGGGFTSDGGGYARNGYKNGGRGDTTRTGKSGSRGDGGEGSAVTAPDASAEWQHPSSRPRQRSRMPWDVELPAAEHRQTEVDARAFGGGRGGNGGRARGRAGGRGEECEEEEEEDDDDDDDDDDDRGGGWSERKRSRSMR
ncbi:unnamed protein product, partial [Sphacelaria rigidula]